MELGEQQSAAIFYLSQCTSYAELRLGAGSEWPGGGARAAVAAATVCGLQGCLRRSATREMRPNQVDELMFASMQDWGNRTEVVHELRLALASLTASLTCLGPMKQPEPVRRGPRAIAGDDAVMTGTDSNCLLMIL